MLRASMFFIAATIAAATMPGVAGAQIANESPVAYSDAPADGSCDNNDGAACSGRLVEESGDYAPDYADDYSAYEGPAYVAPNFYLGVSLLPYGYWASPWPYYGFYGLGWPYYGFASFGFGWPYFGYASYWHGGYWGGHYGWAGYHGPYRYLGNGRYWDQGRYAGSPGHAAPYADSNRATAGRPTTASVPGRASAERTATTGNRAVVTGASATSRNAVTANSTGFAQNTRRGTLPSASYVAAAQRGGSTPAFSQASRSAIAANGRVTGSAVANARNPGSSGAYSARSTNQNYHVTSLPSRGYAPSAYQRNSGAYSAQRGYAPSRGAYQSQQQPYSNPTAHYSGGRGYAPSYSRGGSASAPRSGGGSVAHSSAGGHAGEGSHHH